MQRFARLGSSDSELDTEPQSPSDDSDASVLPEVGGGCALGTDCEAVLDNGHSTGDGTYTIDPDGDAIIGYEFVWLVDGEDSAYTLSGALESDTLTVPASATAPSPGSSSTATSLALSAGP